MESIEDGNAAELKGLAFGLADMAEVICGRDPRIIMRQTVQRPAEGPRVSRITRDPAEFRHINTGETTPDMF